MPTIDQIERTAGHLSALLDELPDGPARHNAIEHVKAVLIYARQAMSQDDEATASPPETTADDAGPVRS